MAWNPVDGMLYIAAEGPTGKEPGVYVYDPRTTSFVRFIPTGRDLPNRIAVEP